MTIKRTVLMPLPTDGFDPTEAGVPWRALTAAGHDVVFATPDGMAARPDPRMLWGSGLGPWRPFLVAAPVAVQACTKMVASAAFQHPLTYAALATTTTDALLLPGGHAPGMRVYLESPLLQRFVAAHFAAGKPVGAICHGVVLAARSLRADGRSVLYGRKTTALLKGQELAAWALTCTWLGSYYRTYPVTVEDEVRASLASPSDFLRGPLPSRRDRPAAVEAGFVVSDGTYVSARWPGDAHRFAAAFLRLVGDTPEFSA